MLAWHSPAQSSGMWLARRGWVTEQSSEVWGELLRVEDPWKAQCLVEDLDPVKAPALTLRQPSLPFVVPGMSETTGPH